MMFLSLAFVFAGLKSYGQGGDINYIDAATTECVAPLPLGDCAADGPLNPIPGKPYIYTVDVTPGVGSNTTNPGYIQWFVYNATSTPSGFGPDIIDGGVLTTNAEPNNGSSQFLLDAHKVGDVTDKTVYNNIANKDVSIEISWQSFDATTNEILLVAYVKGEEGCSDNIEVWRIEPAFAFTLDIAGLMPDGTLPPEGENANECVSPVQSAEYNTGTPGTLTMDYGENYIFFVVNAANYVNSWQPKIGAEHSDGSVISEIAWAYPGEAIDKDFEDWTIINPIDSLGAIVKPIDDAGAVGKDGECIVVRVLVAHGDVENAIASTVT